MHSGRYKRWKPRVVNQTSLVKPKIPATSSSVTALQKAPLDAEVPVTTLKRATSRKEHKPQNSAVEMASAMGIELLTEEQYRELQKLGEFDAKTSSWIKTPSDVRALGGALFCDRRYGKVFVYHNGAQSYYAARGFRGSLRV